MSYYMVHLPIYSKNSLFFILSLIKLSAGNDVNILFQGHIDERHSSAP